MAYLCNSFIFSLFSFVNLRYLCSGKMNSAQINTSIIKMKRQLLLALAATATTMPALAGGLVTNTNQNAAFLRQLSQEAIIDITGLYMNPAGTAFLAPGAHVSFNIQNAKQSRDITTTFPLFAYNVNRTFFVNGNPNSTHEFKGDAYAPVIPSIHFSYNWEKWSINANFALGGGGGKCEFKSGLGSFEALYAGNLYSSVATSLAGVNQQYNTDFAFGGYSLNAYMKGRQYYFGLSLGTTYKVLDNLAIFGGLRTVYASNNYNGWVNDLQVVTTSKMSSASSQVAAVKTGVDAQIAQTIGNSTLELNTDQEGYGITPMFGIDWRINEHWNVAAKYEFKTRLRLKNTSEMNAFAAATAETNPVLGQFKDGTSVAADIPAFFCAGVQYSPISSLRLQTGYHWYGDKSATQYNNKQDNIEGNTWEITAGIEYDLCKWVTLSGGWQKTKYDLSDAYMNDLTFVTNSNSWGVGARVNLPGNWNIDLGFMQTLYDDRTVTTATAAGNKIDVYSRTNRVLGIGLNFKF